MNEITMIDARSYLSNIDSCEIDSFLSETGERIDMSILTRVTVPAGGGVVWTIGDDDDMETAKTIDGIMCLYKPSWVLWGSELMEEGDLPVLVSDDGATAWQVSDDIGDLDPELLDAARIAEGQYDMSQLHYCQFGSAPNERGKRMKERRILGILREGDMLPLIIDLPPTSIKAVKTAMLGKIIPKTGKYYQRAVVSLGLRSESKGGNTYSVATMKLLGLVDEATAERVRSVLTEPMMSYLSSHSLYQQTDDADATS
jgi:hypothetical protein